MVKNIFFCAAVCSSGSAQHFFYHIPTGILHCNSGRRKGSFFRKVRFFCRTWGSYSSPIFQLNTYAALWVRVAVSTTTSAEFMSSQTKYIQFGMKHLQQLYSHIEQCLYQRGNGTTSLKFLNPTKYCSNRSNPIPKPPVSECPKRLKSAYHLRLPPSSPIRWVKRLKSGSRNDPPQISPAPGVKRSKQAQVSSDVLFM